MVIKLFKTLMTLLLKAALALVLETGLDQWWQVYPGFHPVDMTSLFLVYDAFLIKRTGGVES